MYEGTVLLINIQDDILKIQSMGLLDGLLVDKTTKQNIIWATDAYNGLGEAFDRDKEIRAELITGDNTDVIKTRARKALEQQSERTRKRAEVFTPIWICRDMNDQADQIWFDRPDVFFRDGLPTEHIDFPEGKTWQDYVTSTRLEITCGEAPFLVSRYNMENGEVVPVPERVGMLDRKLRVVTENTTTKAEWAQWAIKAVQATYGYEFQGDNVLISRVNVLMSVEEHMEARWRKKPTKAEYRKLINIIAWNIWQMDGITETIPYRKPESMYTQESIFALLGMERDPYEQESKPLCHIYDWAANRSIEYASLRKARE